MSALRRRLFVLGGAAIAFGCRRSASLPASCSDESGLTSEARAARAALAYEDTTAVLDKACRNCQQWVPPKEDTACGGCKLLAGPIHPTGTCKAFAPRG